MKKQATCVYLVKGDKLLFLVRDKKGDMVHRQGTYLPIGGKVEAGEAIEDCARREVEEESGVIVDALAMKGVLYIRGLNSGEDDWILFLFTACDFSGVPLAGNEGSFEWVPYEEVNKLDMYEGDKLYLGYMQKYSFFVADFLYKGFKLQTHSLLFHEDK